MKAALLKSTLGGRDPDQSDESSFVPFLCRMATSVLTPGQIGSPIRGILRDQKNTSVFLGEVVDVNCDDRCVVVSDLDRSNVRSVRLPDSGDRFGS